MTVTCPEVATGGGGFYVENDVQTFPSFVAAVAGAGRAAYDGSARIGLDAAHQWRSDLPYSTVREIEIVRRYRPGARVVRSWALTGGVSARVTAVELEDETVVVRECKRPRHEQNVMERVRAAGLPVPAPLYADDDTLVLEYVEGETGAPPEQLAAFLSALHGVGIVHGDFWPGNVISRDGRIVAVIDWDDAGEGEPLVDVGNCRLELFIAGGDVDAFTDAYRIRHPERAWDELARFDLAAVEDIAPRIPTWRLEPAEETRMLARCAEFVALRR